MKNTSNNTVEFDFRTIKTFNDACVKENINPDILPDLSMIPEEFRKPLIALYRLIIIYKAINNGWIADYSNWDQYKYYPWFEVLPSGLGFSGSAYYFDDTFTSVGSRLCTDTSEKAKYIAKQFESEYKDLFLVA